MHELWLCKNIFEMIQKKFDEKKFKRVKKISLEIGELVAVDPAALIFSFSVITEGTMAKDATLDIIPVHGKAICSVCRKSVNINQYADACSYCGSFELTITQGNELHVKSMEVE